ncbi:MAG: NADP-dependent oxidoreductase [Alphaproteobacteria bacterium]|nr:NADP-dependent oxidoreductase [Alphaproteobacteria bacterium]
MMANQVTNILFKPAPLASVPVAATERHRRWLVARRPVGMPKVEDFLYVEDLVPQPPPGKMLVRCIWLSLDPFQRTAINPSPRAVEIVPLYGVMIGDIVGEVVLSNHPKFRAGDIINEILGWQNYAISEGRGHYIHNPSGARKVDPSLGPISTACGVLGRSGLTAYFSVLRELKPRAGETMVVSSAAGAVGSIAGQIGKIMGCRVIGLTSTDRKCEHLVRDLGFDEAINYKAVNDLHAAVRRAAPKGVDLYYENVGGPIGEAVMGQLSPGARITIVGLMHHYNEVDEQGRPWVWPYLNWGYKQPPFIIHDYDNEEEDGLRVLSAWIKEGRLKYREDVVDGLENAPRAWIDLLNGGNTGKRIVRIGPNPAGVA